MKRRSSIAIRLTLILLCVLVPLMAMALSLYHNGSQTIATQIEGGALSALQTVGEGLSRELKTLYATLSDASGNDALARIVYGAAYLSQAEYYQEVYAFQESLLNTMRGNELIGSVTVYLPGRGKACSVGEESAMDSRVRMYYTYDEAAYDDFIAISQAHGNTTLLSTEQESFVSLLAPAYAYYSERSPSFAMKLCLNEKRLSSYLSDIDARKGRNTAVCHHMSGRYYYGAENTLAPTVFEQLLAFAESTYLREDGPYARAMEFVSDGVQYIAAVRFDDALDMTFMQLISRKDVMASLDQFRGLLYGFLTIALAAFIVCCWLSLSTVRKPILRLVKGFERIEEGDFGVRVMPGRDAGELVYLMNAFNRMAERLEDTVNRLYKSEIYTQRMELNQLQMQINPHFLYNSYFLLDRMLEQGDYETAERVSRHLGEYFRYINRNAQSFVPLPEEWTHANSYARLQALRYERRLSIDIEPVPEALASYIVPRLILQPLLENALEHGLAHTAGDGRCVLRFAREEGHVLIIVEDSGADLTDARLSHLSELLAHHDRPGQDTSALINIHRRLQLYYGHAYGLRLSRSPLGGLRAVLEMPPSSTGASEGGTAS